MTCRAALPAAILFVTTVAAGAAPMKIFLSEPGVYRVSYEDLAAAGWPAGGTSSARLALRHGATNVPIWVEDGGDGDFGPGDAVLFVGDRLPGEHGYYNEYTSLNVYWLFDVATTAATPEASTSSAARLRLGRGGVKSPSTPAPSGWQRRIRQEEDRLLLRYPNAGLEDQELWYWQKLSYLDADQFEVPVDLSDLDGAPANTEAGAADASENAIAITVELRGWSSPRAKPSPDFADHAIEVLWDGAVVGRREWSGTDRAEQVEVRLPRAGVAPAVHKLGLRVPERPAIDNLPLVDVSILNWLEIVAPRVEAVASAAPPAPMAPTARLAPLDPLAPTPSTVSMVSPAPAAPAQLRIEPRPSNAGRPATVSLSGGSRYDLFTDIGERFQLAAPPGVVRRTEVPAASGTWVVSAGSYLAPRALELDRPSDWKNPVHQADYLVVVHPRLAAAVAPLVALRRSQGLTVAEIDVRDIYDEWSAGVTDPRAIRDFVDYAYHDWQAPAPRFLLLVGDASWDGKNERPAGASPDWAFKLSDRAEFIQNGSTPYPSNDVAATRNLIPTWGYGSAEGHAAGDNAFVAIDGDDELPDLAVGRFPVIAPLEVEAIVAKIVAYEKASVPGDWHSRILWVTNEESYTQKASDVLAAELAPRGFTARKIYPVSVVPPTSDDQVALRGAFDEGALIVHFLGHGGRYIWRTAAPDLASQRDLFDLSDVEALAPTGMLPLVLSMTCYSAPFDHPTADSIGEKLLREPGKGAIAVFAASWRNGPREDWSRRLFQELLQAGTVGEAIERVKRHSTSPDLIRQYNLLGDPALRLALPPSPATPAADGPTTGR